MLLIRFLNASSRLGMLKLDLKTPTYKKKETIKTEALLVIIILFFTAICCTLRVF